MEILYGIDTYEQRTRDLEEKEKGKLATKRLKELLNDADSVILKSHGIGKFGRCLGSLFIINEGKEDKEDVSEILLAEGHGVEYFGGSRK
jgi:endonuclease YncB( thermonuclease family)